MDKSAMAGGRASVCDESHNRYRSLFGGCSGWAAEATKVGKRRGKRESSPRVSELAARDSRRVIFSSPDLSQASDLRPIDSGRVSDVRPLVGKWISLSGQWTAKQRPGADASDEALCDELELHLAPIPLLLALLRRDSPFQPSMSPYRAPPSPTMPSQSVDSQPEPESPSKIVRYLLGSEPIGRLTNHPVEPWPKRGQLQCFISDWNCSRKQAYSSTASSIFGRVQAPAMISSWGK